MSLPLLPNPSNVNLILHRISDIWRSINLPLVGYVTDCYDTLPSDVPSANCPFTLLVSAQQRGQVQVHAVNGQLYVADPINMVLCVSRRGAEPTLQINLALALQWRDVVLATFAQHLQLSPAPGGVDQSAYSSFVIDAYITEWVGPIDYTLGQTSFITLQFLYQVREHQVVTFAA